MNIREQYKTETGNDWKMSCSTEQPTTDYVKWLEKAITVTRCCKSDSELLVCDVDYLNNFTKGKKYECKPDGKKHYEVYDDFGDWYSVHKKCFKKQN